METHYVTLASMLNFKAKDRNVEKVALFDYGCRLRWLSQMPIRLVIRSRWFEPERVW